MSSCLVSCCNHQGGLWVVDLDQGKAVQKLMGGNVRGFCQTKDTIYAAQTQGVVCLNRETGNIYKGVGLFGNHPSKNFHHLITWREYLLLVSTGMNRVALLDRETLGILGGFSINERTDDYNHFNTLRIWNGGVLLSMFTLKGKDEQSPWPDNDGAIIYIKDSDIERAFGKTHQCVMSYDIALYGLDRLHDAALIGEAFYTSELQRRNVWQWRYAPRSSKVTSNMTDLRLVGFCHGFYTRGLAQVGDYFVVGASAARSHKKNAAFLQVFPMQDGEPNFAEEVKRIPLPATEVYQIEEEA